MPGIRKPASDHRPSRLLVQEALILLILCIDVQYMGIRFSLSYDLPDTAKPHPA